MKTTFLLVAILVSCVFIKAQYGTINAILDRLEEKKGINQNLENISIDGKKFVLIKDFDDHTERTYIILKGKSLTYVEVFDDKKTGKTSSNVFTGDYIKSRKNIVSVRADKLEGKKIPIPISKIFLFTQQDKIFYLIDANSRERWIDEQSFGKE